MNAIELNLPGYHNVENAIAAIAVCLNLGVAAEEIKQAIAQYRGVKRRFEYILKSSKIIYIDDYAHHPVEIEALLKSVRSMYPENKITVAFQPHLYSRTRDFADDFAKSLAIADQLFLLNIYPARELPIPGVTSNMVFDSVPLKDKWLCSKNDLLDKLFHAELEILLTVGAGDIDQLVEPIKKMLKTKYELEG